MADKPADVDPREWVPEDAKTTLDQLPDLSLDAEAIPEPIPQASAPTVVIDANTAPHKLRELPGYEVGFRAGFVAGRLEGAADVRSQDMEAGRAEMLDAFRRAMIASGSDPTIAFIEMQKLREWARANPSAR